MEIEENFDFKGKIGEGCFATVWKAIDNLGREVAVKIFNPSVVFVSDEENLKSIISNMLLSHAKLLAKVDHPNVVKIHHVTKVKNPNGVGIVDAIVMEYLNGCTLRKKLERILLIEEAIFIGNSIIDGLKAIHEKEITHNDLLTQNIMVSPQIVKIIDPNSEQNSFILSSTLSKKEQFKRDITFLKEILGAIISKIPDFNLAVTYFFKDQILDEFDFQKIKEHFNKTLSKETINKVPTSILNNSSNQLNNNETSNIIEKLKEYISDDKYRIKLDDFITTELKKTLPKLSKEFFPLEGIEPNAETILERLKNYENIVGNLSLITITLSQWGMDKQISFFNKIFKRLSDNIEQEGGKVYFLKLRWYPLLILFYCSGISAIYSENYQYLYSLFFCKMPGDYDSYNDKKYLINSLAKNLTRLDSGDEIFKMIPEYENNRVATSKYMFETIKPILEDTLFLGKSYETLFDRFEIFFVLVYADINTNGIYGPTGRFIYKFKSRYGIESKNNPFNELINEANQKKENWDPLKAGFFSGSYERFIEVANNYKKFMESIN